MEIQAQPEQQRIGRGCWKFGIFGCGAVVLVMIIGISWMTYTLWRNPKIRGIVNDTMTCRTQMTEISAALGRYEANNQAYPKDLKALVPDYLATSKILHCPADSDPARLVSYTYTQPSEDSPKTMIILVCTNHKLPKGMLIPLGIRKDGEFIADQKLKQ